MGGLATPAGLLGLANTVGGELVAAQGAYNLGQEAASPYTGADETAVSAAYSAGRSKAGLIGQGLNEIASVFGLTTGMSAAQEAAFSEAEAANLQSGFNVAQGVDTSIAEQGAAMLGLPAAISNTAGMQAEAEAINNEIEAATAVGADGVVGSGVQGISSVEGAAGKGGFVTGLVQSGIQAEQGAPVTGNFAQAAGGSGIGVSGATPGGSMGPAGTPGAAGMDAGPGVGAGK
jgi:hypothetical protein